MVYKWLFDLSDYYSVFNIFRYITFRSFLSFFSAFFICWLYAPYFIKNLNKKKLKEEINTFGPDSHKKKQGTPTMGGVLVLLSLFISSLLWVDLTQPLVWGCLSMLFSFGVIGFADDLIKTKFKKVQGIKPRYRLLYEFSVSSLLLWILIYTNQIDPILYIPFFKDLAFDLSWFYILFGSFVITGCANAVNLTDGLDGLAIVPIMVCAGALAVFSYVSGHFDLSLYLGIPFISGVGEVTPLASAVVAGGLGFLWYNTYPSQVFMGDTGSLSLGAFLGTLAVFTKNELLMIILGGVFVIEAVSVILQVGYFKLTRKRIFAMTPIHHHFELKGMAESKIIVRFWIVACLLAVISLATLKMR